MGIKIKNFDLDLTTPERQTCLRQIMHRNYKLLHVYEQSLLPNNNYDYKAYVRNLIIYVSTSDTLFDGLLTNIIINLCSIEQNDFNKDQIRQLVCENTNFVKYLLGEGGEENGNN